MAPSLDTAGEDLKRRVGRKLTKRRREGHQVTMDIPERFRDGDDADEDVTKPKGQQMFMNQSVFGMIAAAGSQVDFNARFEGQSSDEEDESPEPNRRDESSDRSKPVPEINPSATSTSKHRRKFSENKLSKSLQNLAIRTKRGPTGSKGKADKKTTQEETVESPTIEVTRTRTNTTTSKGRPVMSQMLDAKAELAQRPSFDLPRHSSDRTMIGEEADNGVSSLAKRLMQIFGFDTPEDVIEGMLSSRLGKGIY